jgi:hypothetical protein
MLMDPDDCAVNDSVFEIGVFRQNIKNFKTPFLDQRRKRRNALFQHPKQTGKSRQGAPVRTIHKTASTNSRLLAAVRPGSLFLPGKIGAIFSNWASLNRNRSKADLQFSALNHCSPEK